MSVRWFEEKLYPKYGQRFLVTRTLYRKKTPFQTLEILDGLLLASESGAPFGSTDVKPETVEARSQLPDGIRYLAGLGRTVLADPVFAGLGDPVNQSHLFQLMCDLESTTVNNVAFRDKSLASRIFPEA